MKLVGKDGEVRTVTATDNVPCDATITDEALDGLVKNEEVPANIRSVLAELQALRYQRNRIAGGTGDVYDLLRALLASDDPAGVLQRSFVDTASAAVQAMLGDLLVWARKHVAAGSRSAGHLGTWQMVVTQIEQRLASLHAVTN